MSNPIRPKYKPQTNCYEGSQIPVPHVVYMNPDNNEREISVYMKERPIHFGDFKTGDIIRLATSGGMIEVSPAALQEILDWYNAGAEPLFNPDPSKPMVYDPKTKKSVAKKVKTKTK